VTTGAAILEGIGWGLLGAVTRTVAKRVVGASSGSSDIAGLAVPIVSAVVAGRDVQTAVVGSSIGVGLAELGDRVVPATGRIVAWGDSHGEDQPRLEILTRMATEPAVDAYVFLGDAEGWVRWREETAKLRVRARVFAVNGNHDDDPGSAVAGAALPAVLRLATANVVLLRDPPTRRDVESAMRMLDMTLEHTLVFLHRSPIDFSRENASGVVLVRNALEPLLDRGCFVFCGHHHVYGWGTLGPSSVVSAGIAGSKHYTCDCHRPCIECDDEVRGYVRIDVGEKIRVSLVPVTVSHG
jgi:predicted phosphodiesterase